MQKLMKAMHKNEKGFTLVELMVVVVIIGILVAIAIPLYSGIQANARNNACDANVRTLQGAVAQYQTETGNIPSTIGDLWNLEEGDGVVTSPQFVEEAPQCAWSDVPGGEGDDDSDYSMDTDGNITCAADDCEADND